MVSLPEFSKVGSGKIRLFLVLFVSVLGNRMRKYVLRNVLENVIYIIFHERDIFYCTCHVLGILMVCFGRFEMSF